MLQQPGFLAEQLQKLIGAELLLLGGTQRRQGEAQIVQLRIQLLGAEVALAGHHLRKTLAALALLHRVGRHHRLTAEPPGPAGREQLRQGSAQARRFNRLDAQIEACGQSSQPHEDLEQLGWPKSRAVVGQ